MPCWSWHCYAFLLPALPFRRPTLLFLPCCLFVRHDLFLGGGCCAPRNKKDRERWLKKVGQCGLEQALGEYNKIKEIERYRGSNDQP